MDWCVIGIGVLAVVTALASRRPKPPKVDLPVGPSSDPIRRALAIVGLSQKEAAYLMGIDECELSRQLTTRGVNSARLSLLGPEFQQVYGQLLVGVQPFGVALGEVRPRVDPVAARGYVEGLVAGHLAVLGRMA